MKPSNRLELRSVVTPVINVATLTATPARQVTRAAVVVQATNRPELPAKPANVVQLQEPAINVLNHILALNRVRFIPVYVIVNVVLQTAVSAER